MKKTTLFILSFLVTLSVLAQKKSPYLVKNFPASSIKNLEVNTSGGYITVNGHNEAQAEVKVFVSGNNRKSEYTEKQVNDLMQNYILDVVNEGNVLKCVAKAKKEIDWKQSISISFEILLPVKINANLKTSGGAISLNNLNGNLEFSTSGGGLSINNLNGNINGRTSGGAINILDSEGEITMKTSGGSINAKNSKGDINLSTSGGSLDLNNLKGNVIAKTSGGSIDSDNINGSLILSTSGGSIDIKNITGDVVASTSGGGINAKINKLGKKLKLSTSAGSIRANLPFNSGMDLDISGSKIKSEKLAKVSNKVSTGRVKGKVNGGGTEVVISASVGTVYLD